MSNALVPYVPPGPLVPYVPPVRALTRAAKLLRGLKFVGRVIPYYALVDFVVEEATGKSIEEHAIEKAREFFAAGGEPDPEKAKEKTVSPE